ncbi:MAG: sigma-70 family RNA polymerase sigma factor [Deltaproteobacteria bacterium]|nr:sigma-70 family RNA polymerase sigma factor [Deltaproteobacteria bacterium]
MIGNALYEQTPEEDRLRIRAFLEGDRTAFDSIVLCHQDSVYNLCLRLMGDREDAADCAQEVFLRVFRSLKGFRFRSRFSTWLYAIVVNTCRNRLNSAEFRNRSRKVSIQSFFENSESREGHDVEDPAPTPLARLAQKERDRLVQAAINELPSEGRELVILRDMEELSYEEIVAVTGYNLGTVKSRLARARQQLREKLKGVM